ncbi:hypothetical protein [Klebsiella phage phiKp_32]|nr:hypothetical protein [Klebsiella phage phiKp_32]
MEKKKEPSLSKSDLPENMLRTPFDLVDDYQENKKGVVKLALPNDQLPTDALGRTPDLRSDGSPAFRREDLFKGLRAVEIAPVPEKSSDSGNVQQQRIELLIKKIAEMFDCSEERAAGIVKEALAQRNIDQTLDSMFDNISKFQEIGVVNGMPPKLIPPASGVMWINLVDPATGEPIKREDLVKAMQDVDLEEAYPGTRKTNPELYRTSPYPTPEEMITSQNIGMGKLVHVTDKWFFYRHHQFHSIHHKRRKAHFDEISLMLIRFNWVQYKEALHKKKYHIFDKTPRAKAERLALKRSREKIKSTLMIS